MAIGILGQVIGAAKNVIHLVDGEEKETTIKPSPQVLAVQAETPEAAQRVAAVIDHLAGQGNLKSALEALEPGLVGNLPEDEADLVAALQLYRSAKEYLANDGRIDGGEAADLLRQAGELFHVDDLLKGFAGGLLDRFLTFGRKKNA